MVEYVGLDVSLEEAAVCVIDGDGAVVAESKVASDPDVIAAYLAPWAGTVRRVGLEAGALSSWLHGGLAAAGLPAVCIETRRMHAYAKASPVKTDRKDAKLIALAMRAGLYRAVHVKSEDSQKVRLLLTSRQMLLRQARRLQGKIRGDLKPFGVKLGQVGSGGFAARVRAKLAERPDLWALVQPVLEARAALLVQVRGYDRALRPLAAAHPVCRRLMMAPGVGPITALAFCAGIDRLGRFAKARSVPAALGLTPRLYQSGESVHHGAITKTGDRLLRCLLFEAANALLTRTRGWCALKRWGMAIAKRRGLNRARVALARKLAMILYCMWRDGTEFRWNTAAEPAPATA